MLCSYPCPVSVQHLHYYGSYEFCKFINSQSYHVPLKVRITWVITQNVVLLVEYLRLRLFLDLNTVLCRLHTVIRKFICVVCRIIICDGTPIVGNYWVEVAVKAVRCRQRVKPPAIFDHAPMDIPRAAMMAFLFPSSH